MGMGIWVIEMVDEFVGVEVLGVDLSLYQLDWVLFNVKFMIDDVESLWLYLSNYFDYIYLRYMVMVIKDWLRLMRWVQE